MNMNRAATVRAIVAGGLVLNLATTSVAPQAMAATSAPAKIVAQAPPPAKMRIPDTLRAKAAALHVTHPQRPTLAARGVHVGGIRVVGPALLKNPVHPKNAPPDPYAMSAKYRQMRGIRLPQPAGTPAASTPALRGAQSSAIRTGSTSRAPTATRRLASVSLGSPNLTGINHYWTYEEDALPGIGKYMANIGNGNLIIQADDMAIPHKSVELAFRRTYNSRSQHDYAGSDGSQISNYGAGWTNTFDAHLAANSGNQYGAGLSVYDIDGARYDYLPDGQGHWLPPAGQFATLTYDGGNGYFWTKKSGTVYYFLSVYFGSSLAALEGRLVEIYGRNNNTHITFSYAFQNGDPSCSCNLTDIFAMEEDGRYATLAFSDFTVNGQPQRLLSTLTWPDGTVVAYNYDTAGNLSEVDEPPNNTSTTNCHSGMAHCLPELYVYQGGSLIDYVVSPRYMLGLFYGIPENTGSTLAGSATGFCFTSGLLSCVASIGYMRPTPADGTNTPIQPGADGGYYRIAYLYAVSSGSAIWADADGHGTVYYFDAQGRVTLTYRATGTTTLATTQAWDAQDNLIATTDARGYETDYAYDGNGNAIAVALPAVQNSDGYYRPTTLLSYDQNNNVTASCDAEFVHNSLHADWSARPAPVDTLCQQQSGATLMSWLAPAAGYEPFGELTTITKPLGQTISYTYDPGHQGGTDFGLPTYVTGATVPATQTFTYSATGDLVTYDKGTGGVWQLTYDTLGRLLTATDPDNVTSHTYYHPNGTISKTETALQHASGMGALFAYDADGNEISETHHHGCVPTATCIAGITSKFYDGADRLVEVMQAASTQNAMTPWLTRYLYDLTLGGTVSISGSATFHAYGNLYATREYFGTSVSWVDMRGNAYDALDRVTQKLTYQPCNGTSGGVCSEAPGITAYSFDANSATAGLLASATDPLSQSTSYTYDAAGRKTAMTFAGDGGVTPSRAYTFDGDGRETTIVSSVGTQAYTYDGNGRKSTATQPLGNGTSATMSYTYYDNGLKSGVSVSSPTVNAALTTWAYRTDGLMTSATLMGNVFARTYTPAGRETAFQDPYFTAHRTYDATTGLLTSHDVAAGTYSAIAHDYEGSIVGYTAFGGQTAAMTLTPLGELATQTYSPGLIDDGSNQLWPQISQGYVNGHADNGQPWDFRNAVSLATNPSFQNQGQCIGGNMPAMCSWNINKSFAFDAAGRETSGTDSWNSSYSCNGSNQRGSPYNNTCNKSGSGSFTARYDAENHLLGKTYQTWPYVDSVVELGPLNGVTSTTTSYTYGPAGHPVIMAGLNVYWDDDEVLLTTNSSGQVTDVKVGLDADFSGLSGNASMTVWDRDPSDIVASGHNSTGIDAWAPPNPYHKVQPPPPANAPGPSVNYLGFTPAITAPGSDGYFDGDSVLQGVRAYDPQLGAWTAPDAYSGRAHDPASQKPYMWNRNNAFDYADPSGYIVDTSHWSPAEMQAYHDAVTYLSKSPTAAAIIDKVATSETTYNINFNSKNNDDYNSQSHIISWDSASALWATKGTMSPAMGLIHEMDHASIPAEKLEKDRNTPDLSGLSNDMEHARVTNDEHKIADELNSGEGSRTGDKVGKSFHTDSVTGHKPVE
jgi:YD repeat-containing protein